MDQKYHITNTSYPQKKNLAVNILTKRSKLLSSTVGQPDIMCQWFEAIKQYVIPTTYIVEYYKLFTPKTFILSVTSGNNEKISECGPMYKTNGLDSENTSTGSSVLSTLDWGAGETKQLSVVHET